MEFTDQMATKLLAQAVQQLGLATNEALCVHPDRAIVLRLVREARESLEEFEGSYAEVAADAAGGT